MIRIGVLFLFSLLAVVGISFTQSPEIITGTQTPLASQNDSMWDLLDTIDLEILSPYCVGIEFAEGEWYVSHGGDSPSSNTDNIIAVIDPVTHDTVRTFLQPQTYSGWGFHDLAYDGEYLYGAGGPNVFQFDLYGNVIGTFPGPAQLNALRALAYDPVEDVFYSSGAWNEPIYKFDRNGNVLGEWSHSLWAILGLAWDTSSPDGPWLWIHASDWQGIQRSSIHQWDPVTHSLTGISYLNPIPPGYSEIAGGGLCITDEWEPGLSVFGALCQGVPEDLILVIEHMELVTYDWEISLSLTSGDPVPPGGGVIGFDAELTSNESNVSVGDSWIDLEMPTGDTYTLLNRLVELQPFANIQRSMTVNIPASAPAGDYTLYGRCGVYPGTVWDEASFSFEKQADGEGIFNPAQFKINGWDMDKDPLVSVQQSSDYITMNVYPNPFNPNTAISYQLSAIGYVNLAVYDISGREVARLVDGIQSAGMYEVTFDGSELTSGVYFTRIQAGEFTNTHRLMLVK